jgi:hypothetical protein
MKFGRNRSSVVTTLFALIAGATVASTPLRAATEPPEPLIPCEEETVYGTVVVLDEQNGLFGLEGNEYEFVADQPEVVRELDGLQVRMEVAVDCSIRDLHIIGDTDALTRGPIDPASPC